MTDKEELKREERICIYCYIKMIEGLENTKGFTQKYYRCPKCNNKIWK